MNSMQIPAHVEQIIHTLNSHGYEAFAVGGCVRDPLLGRKPGDWDITTSARPEQVKALFRRTIDTGIQHGTVTIMMDRTGNFLPRSSVWYKTSALLTANS